LPVQNPYQQEKGSKNKALQCALSDIRQLKNIATTAAFIENAKNKHLLLRKQSTEKAAALFPLVGKKARYLNKKVLSPEAGVIKK
jgi:hypothetical protein